MTVTAQVAAFRPSEQGFRFTNSFPPEPAVTLDLGPVGRVGLGDASGGLCGGMAYAVRDYFEAGLPIPDAAAPPAKDTPLFRYIVSRLLDSFDVPVGVARYLTWMALPAADVRVLGAQLRGAGHRTVQESWPAVRSDIDSGHPSTLGVVPVHTSDVRQVGKCHQVLVYAYSVDDGVATLAIYDPNTPLARADDVHIRLPLDASGAAVTIEHTINIAEPTLHGFFRTRYQAVLPPAPCSSRTRSHPRPLAGRRAGAHRASVSSTGEPDRSCAIRAGIC